jgi:hypothetical protein
MAWRKTDEQKKAEGSYRPDRAAPVKTVEAAELALTTTITTLAAAQKKLLTLKGSKKATARRNLQTLIEIQTRRLQQAREDMSNAMRQAAVRAAAPSIRPGLELMGHDEVMNAQPPLSDAEELEWLSISGSEEDLIQRRRAAALPLTVKDAELIRSILSHMEYLAGQRNLTATEAARLRLFREHLAYFEAPRRDCR